MINRKIKCALAKTLALTLVFSMIGISASDADAAKRPKLSTKKVTLAVKTTKKIKINNVKAKKVKKLSVKINKKKIASIRKNGKTAFTITAKKTGTAVITTKVKVGKKVTTLKLNLNVYNKAADKTAAPVATATATATTASATPTVPTATTKPSASPSVTATTTPTVSATPVVSTTPDVTETPTATPTVDPNAVTPAPNAGEKRITNTSNIKNPIISNISIWGLRDNPYAETGYDYTQYGPFSGIFTKWYEPKEAFKAIHDLFSPAVAQSVNTYLGAADTDVKATPDPLGTTSDTSVKSVLTYISGPDSNQTVETHAIDVVSRTSVSNKDQRVTVVDGTTLDATGTGSEPAVLVSGRKNNWHGVQVDITDYISDPTKDYKLSMEITHKLSSHNSSQFYTQMAFADAEGVEDSDRPTLVMQSVTANQWKKFSANFSTNGYTAQHFIMFANWYGNTTTYDDFYIKNITVQELYSDKEYDTTETLSYSPLYENTEKNSGFSLGAVIGNAAFKDQNYKDVINKHFSSLTVDNDLKMYSMLDQDATIANENGDGMPVLCKDGNGEAIVKWAYENGIGVRGHTIVCDTAMSTNCKYFFHEDYDTTKPLASKEVMLKRLQSFITQCISYFEEKYPGTIYTWDVVNEAISTTNGEYDSDDTCQIQTDDNMFYDTIGHDYVDYSFLYARQAVNSLKEKYTDRDINIKLFYNDFNCFQKNKRNAICALVKEIKDFGASNNMGQLIDGVGMQCYIGYKGGEFPTNILATNTKRTADSIPNAVFMFHDLGLEVQFTELTIRNYDETKNSDQATYYKQFMEMAIGINNGTITKVLS